MVRVKLRQIDSDGQMDSGKVRERILANGFPPNLSGIGWAKNLKQIPLTGLPAEVQAKLWQNCMQHCPPRHQALLGLLQLHQIALRMRIRPDC